MCKIMEDYAKESNIQNITETYKELGQTIDSAIKKIMEKFNLSHDDAARKVSQYWGAQ